MEALVHQRNSLVLILVNQRQPLLVCEFVCLYKVKAINKNVNILNQFYLASISNKFGYVEAKEVSLKRYLYDFSVDYYAIDKSDILRIVNYLMVKNNIKQCSGLLNKCLLCYSVLLNF